MPRFVSLLLGIALMLAALPVSASPTTPTVIVNGQVLQFDVPPVIENGRTLAPMRAIFEALGAEVYWDQETQTVSAFRGDIGMAIQIGYPYANLNGEAYELDATAKLVDGRTMVPLRFISEALGANVTWDQETFTAIITDLTIATFPLEPPTQPEAPSIASPLVGGWSDTDTFLMVDKITGLPAAPDWAGEWYFFREDGTYRYAIAGCGPAICGLLIIDGKYQVEGDQILLYERLADSFPSPTDPRDREPYKDKPYDDEAFTFTITDEGDLKLTDAFGFSNIFYRVPTE